MTLEKLYLREIDREVNPAVSATQLDKKVIKAEVEEYVFTKEILKNLFTVLSNIKHNKTSHCGIWISGYYGSGKSHFLKFLDYCMSPQLCKEAETDPMFQMETATAQYDPFNDDVNWMPNEIRELTDWYSNQAHIETVMFNIGSSYNANSDKTRIFTEVLWSEFNAMRGYNKFNIALAQYLEKFLDKQGKFEEFKQRLSDEYGFDWDTDASDLATTELDIPLNLAQEIVPTFSVDAARHAIINRSVDMSVNAFADELAQYVASKNNPHYRLVFFIDEVSQFIHGDGRLLLQLQSVVKEINDRCNSHVWVACTAQQDLKEILDNCQINESSDEFGKILGRFEVQASLSGTSSEYIAQKRILAKSPEGEAELTRFYNRSASAIETQFQLPSTYEGYNNKESFINYYPFVPYQLQLIKNVFTHFVHLNYVNKEVKGNERSVIRIIHNIAKLNKDAEVGTFISFDQFYNDMFSTSLQPSGVQARRVAQDAAAKYDKDKEFAMRVVNILFMICNMSVENKQQFPATIDNIVTLLMRDIDTPKTTIKDDVQRVIDFLKEKSVIRETKPEVGAVFYEFFTEEETLLSIMINNTRVDSNTEAEQLAAIFSSYFSPQNKESIGAASVSVGVSTSGKRMFGNNPDVEVEFVIASPQADANTYSFSNPRNKLVFFLTSQYNQDKKLSSLFYHYCQLQKYAREQNLSAEGRKTLETFIQREKVIYEKEICPRLHAMLDTCPVISGTRLLDKVEIGEVKGKNRYKEAMATHLKTVYNLASLVNGPNIAKNPNDLRTHMLRRLDPNEYAIKPMSEAEQVVKNYILQRGTDVTVADVVATFAKAPYGWSEHATIDVINELYRRNIFSYAYNNNPNVKISEVADKIIREKTRFTLEPAQVVSQEVINMFVEAWKAIFNKPMPTTTDSRELYDLCTNGADIKDLLNKYTNIRKEISRFPFVSDIDKAIEMVNGWIAIKDQTTFFETVTEQRDEAAALIDRCKLVEEFYNEQLDKYRSMLSFINGNQSNFELLGAEAKGDIDSLRAIVDDAEVYAHFRDYIRYQKAVNARIQAKKTELVDAVRDSYNQVYDQLRTIASGKQVDPSFLPDLEAKMLVVKGENNLYHLRDMADVSDFQTDMINVINKIVEERDSNSGNSGSGNNSNGNGGGTSQPKPKKINTVKLKTATTQPLKTEQDVDTYLASLKVELMNHINNNEEILIK